MAANWNNVRQAIYVLGAGILGAAAALGWITADQGEQLTSALVEILGAVALIVAAANVNKGVQASAPKSEGLPVYDGPTSTVIEDGGYVGRHRAAG